MRIAERFIQSDAQTSANGPELASLESENAGLRRMIVELIEQNQSLREQLQRIDAHRDVALGGNTSVVQVDPQAA